MTPTGRHPRLADSARRVWPALVIFILTGGAVLLLTRLRVPIADAATGKNYGIFVVGLAGALFLTRLLDVLVFDLGYRLRDRPDAPALLRQLVALLIFGILIGALSQLVLSANLTLLLTSSAIITAVIGLSLQETLGNFFSGLALAIERTVQVGDLLRTGETIGLVEQLSWRAIKIRTMEGSSILVPNTVASRERMEVFRRGGPPIARVLRVGLEYDAAPARIRSALESALRDLPGVVAYPAPMAYLAGFGDFAVTYELRYWLEDYARYLDVDSRVRERVWYRLSREKLKIAYPLIRQHQYAAGPLPNVLENDEVPEAVATSALFAPLSAAELKQLTAGAKSHRFAESETIVREGDATSSMFLIVEGRVAVSARGAGASQKLAVLEPGSAFGEISLLTGEPRIATVRALTEATLVEIDKETLAPILQANPSLVEKLDAIIEARRRETADRIVTAQEVSVAGEPRSLRARIARFFGLSGIS